MLWIVNPNGESAGVDVDPDAAGAASRQPEPVRAPEAERPTGAEHPADSDPSTGSIERPATGPLSILFGPMQDGIMVPRGFVVGGLAAIGALVIVVLGLLIALLFASFDGGGGDADASKPEDTAAEKPVDPSPEPDSGTETADGTADGTEDDPGTVALREPFTIGNVTLSVSSIEPVNLVSTNDGGTLSPEPGKQLYLLKTAYVNSTNQVDLSCGDPEVELKMLDADGGEIEQTPGLELVPGNLGCGQFVFPTTPREWNLVFEGDADAPPAELFVTASAGAAANAGAATDPAAAADPAAGPDAESAPSTDPVTVELG